MDLSRPNRIFLEIISEPIIEIAWYAEFRIGKKLETKRAQSKQRD